MNEKILILKDGLNQENLLCLTGHSDLCNAARRDEMTVIRHQDFSSRSGSESACV